MSICLSGEYPRFSDSTALIFLKVSICCKLNSRSFLSSEAAKCENNDATLTSFLPLNPSKIWGTSFSQKPSLLKPVASLKTIISQIHKIEPNESVGYNRAYKAKDYKITATLPIGHADGISRQYGNGKTFVLLHGKKAPIIGNVCMDMIMIDITGIECKEGDEVIIFGNGLSAENFAKGANTISYELLTAISPRVKRVIK